MTQKNKNTILVADDDKFIRERLDLIFSQAGYFVRKAKSGEEAMNIITQGGVELAILDFHLEDITGDELIDQIRDRDKSIPVIVITGDESIEPERKVREKGVFAFFMKPLELEIMKKTVAAALKLRQKAVQGN